MKSAYTCKKIREEKLRELEEFKNKIQEQWRVIEGKVDNANININTQYIQLGKINLYKENVRKLLELDYFISEDKNGIVKLYFDKKDYDSVNFNSNKKENSEIKIGNILKANTKAENDISKDVQDLLKNLMYYEI